MAARQDDGLNASVTNASGNPVPGNQITPLLTVWRWLHVEVDSMGPVVSNYVTGNITAISGSATAATNLTLDVSLWTGVTPADNSQNLSWSTNRGRFQNGRILMGPNMVLTSGLYGNGDEILVNFGGFLVPGAVIAGGNTINAGQIAALTGIVFSITGDLGATSYAGSLFRVTGTGFTIASNTAHTVTVTNTVKIPFTLYDDDGAILPHLPDTALMAAKFAPAYIAPIVDGGGNTNNNKQTIRFQANVDSANSTAINYQLSKPGAFESDGNRDKNYWVAYIQTAYQAEITKDYDPDGSPESVVAAQAVNSGGTSARRGALYFHESTRDYGIQFSLTLSQTITLERRHVIHEIGHQFGITHLDPSHNIGIYHDADEYDLTIDPGFEPVHLNVLRSKITSPGH